jgi:hypothetical protein
MTVFQLIQELNKLPPDLDVFLEYSKTDCTCADGNGDNRCYCGQVTHRDSIESVDRSKLDEDGKYAKEHVILNMK